MRLQKCCGFAFRAQQSDSPHVGWLVITGKFVFIPVSSDGRRVPTGKWGQTVTYHQPHKLTDEYSVHADEPSGCWLTTLLGLACPTIMKSLILIFARWDPSALGLGVSTTATALS